MKGDIILKEMERRKDLLSAHETDKTEFQRIQGEVADLQAQLEAKKAELDVAGAKVTQFDGAAIEAEYDELRDIAIDLGLIEPPAVEEVATADEAVVAEPTEAVAVEENNQGEVASVSLSDLL